MDVSTIQGQIAAMAKRYPERGLTSLNKYLDEDWLRRRHRQGNAWNWDWYERTIVANYPLPRPRIVHSVYHRANP